MWLERLRCLTAHGLSKAGQWAPFGSRDLAGKIVRCEWDLDGDGSFETDATATGGCTQRLYTRPRTYTPTLRVTNEQGQQATAAASVVVRHPASSSVDDDQIFDDTRLRRVTLRFTRADWDRMMADPTLKIRVEGEAVIFGERLEGVGIGPRGNFTLRIAGEKIPWQIDTDQFLSGQEFHNLKQLLLANNISDPGMIGEKLAYDLLELAGAPFIADTQQLIPRLRVQDFKPGVKVKVRYDPETKEVALLTDPNGPS